MPTWLKSDWKIASSQDSAEKVSYCTSNDVHCTGNTSSSFTYLFISEYMVSSCSPRQTTNAVVSPFQMSTFQRGHTACWRGSADVQHCDWQSPSTCDHSQSENQQTCSRINQLTTISNSTLTSQILLIAKHYWR